MSDEPDWLNPENDRKTPYTEMELDEFVEGFIAGLEADEWKAIKEKYGDQEARSIVKEGFRARDERSLSNLDPGDIIH